MKVGDSGEHVAALQTVINAAGLAPYAKLTVDGQCGPLTIAAAYAHFEAKGITLHELLTTHGDGRTTGTIPDMLWKGELIDVALRLLAPVFLDE